MTRFRWFPMYPVPLIRNVTSFLAGLLPGVLAGYLASGLKTAPGPVIVVFLAGLIMILVVSATAGLVGKIGVRLARDRLGRDVGHLLMIEGAWHARSRVAIYLAAYALGLALASLFSAQTLGAALSGY